MQAVPRSRVHFREGAWANVLVVMMGVVMWLVFRHTAPAHDVAWLMEGARRWLEGARLYDGIRELNPPLIFYDMVGLSAGTTSNVVFVAGVAATSVITSLWVGRYHGVFLSVGTISVHVHHILQKLGLRSRWQVADRLAAPDAPSDDPQ